MLVIVIIILLIDCYITFFWWLDKSDDAQYHKRQVELLEEHKRLYLESKYTYKDRNENKKRTTYIKIDNLITIVKRWLRELH